MAALRRDFLPAGLRRRDGARRASIASIAVQARQTRRGDALAARARRRYPFIAGVVGWVDLQVGRRRRAARARRARIRGWSASGTSCRRSRTASSRGRRSGAASPGSSATGWRTTSWSTRGSCRAAIEFARGVSAAALRARSSGQAGHPRRRVRRLAAAISTELAALPQRMVQAVGAGDRSGLARRGRRRSCGRTSTPRSSAFGADRLMIGSDWPVCTRGGAPTRDVMRCVVRRSARARSTAGRNVSAVLGGHGAPEFWNLSLMRADTVMKRMRWRQHALAARGGRGCGGAQERRQPASSGAHDRGHPEGDDARVLAEHPRRRRTRRQGARRRDHLARTAARGRSRLAGLRGRRASSAAASRASCSRRSTKPRWSARSASGMQPQDPGRDLRLRAEGRRLRQLRRHRQPQGRPPGRRAAGEVLAARARSSCCATPKGTTAPASASRASSTR